MDLGNLEELVDQFLWINTSLGNWSYVLRALELKVKLAGKEKGELNYEEMLNSLELSTWILYKNFYLKMQILELELWKTIYKNLKC